MKTWLGFGDLALIFKVIAVRNRSNLNVCGDPLGRHLFSLKTILVVKIFCWHNTASFDTWISSVQDFGNFELFTGPQIRLCNWKLFSYFSTKTYVEGTQKNRLNETVLFSIQTICLNWWVRKVIAIFHWNFLLNWPYAFTHVRIRSQLPLKMKMSEPKN